MRYCVAINGWTDEAIQWLKVAWYADKLTTAEMGRELGCSLNAVVGKAHRLQLKAKPSPIRKVTAPRQPEKRHRKATTQVRHTFPKPPKKRKPEPPRPMPVLAKPDGPQCSWLEGPPYKFSCPNAPKPGSSYCEHHHPMVWQPIPKRRRAYGEQAESAA